MENSVQDFYKSKNIFITGGTGFLGSFVVEKLLRSFKDVNKIYILIRGKKGESTSDRKHKYFQDRLFNVMKKENPTYFKKIIFIHGEFRHKYLELSDDTLEMLNSCINVVFHIGANIRLHYPLSELVADNLIPTRNLLEICKNMKHLQSFIFVSSVFCFQKKSVSLIDDQIYPHDIDPEELINMYYECGTDELNKRVPDILSDWLSTYAYVKNAAENICLKYKQYFPIAIIRPGAIAPSYIDPIPYYENSNAALIGVIRAIQQKQINKFLLGEHVATQSVPVDFTANAVLAMPYVVANEKYISIPVFNYSSSKNVVTFKEAVTWGTKYSNINISDILIFNNDDAEHAKRYTSNEVIAKFFKSVEYYSVNNLVTINNNIEELWKNFSEKDKIILPFDTSVIDWEKYFYEYGKIIYDNYKELEEQLQKNSTTTCK